MSDREYITINPEEKDRKIILDQTKEVVLSSTSKSYSLILELPEGSKEKYNFEANREYIISYNKRNIQSHNRDLIGDVIDISFNVIA